MVLNIFVMLDSISVTYRFRNVDGVYTANVVNGIVLDVSYSLEDSFPAVYQSLVVDLAKGIHIKFENQSITGYRDKYGNILVRSKIDNYDLN